MEITITIKLNDEDLKKMELDSEKNEEVEVEKKTEDDKSEVSMYARFFDDSCIGWNKDVFMNLVFLKERERYCNDLLKAKGYLFLNEVYDALGMAVTKTGQVVGWIYDKDNPIGDNYIDFHLNADRNREFINGYENVILLDFNVDGNILDRMPEE